MSMDRVTVKRPPAFVPTGHSRWLIRHPENMENRTERRRKLRDLRRLAASDLLYKILGYRRAMTGSRVGHWGSKPSYKANGAFGGRTVEDRMAKIKQTCPDRYDAKKRARRSW